MEIDFNDFTQKLNEIEFSSEELLQYGFSSQNEVIRHILALNDLEHASLSNASASTINIPLTEEHPTVDSTALLSMALKGSLQTGYASF